MDTDCFIVYIKANNIYKDIAEDVETRSDTSNYDLDRPLPKENNKKVIRSMKDELGRKIMIKFVGLRAEAYSYLLDDGSEDKKSKYKNKCVIKWKLKSKNCNKCLEVTQLQNKINYIEKIKLA